MGPPPCPLPSSPPQKYSPVVVESFRSVCSECCWYQDHIFSCAYNPQLAFLRADFEHCASFSATEAPFTRIPILSKTDWFLLRIIRPHADGVLGIRVSVWMVKCDSKVLRIDADLLNTRAKKKTPFLENTRVLVWARPDFKYDSTCGRRFFKIPFRLWFLDPAYGKQFTPHTIHPIPKWRARGKSWGKLHDNEATRANAKTPSWRHSLFSEKGIPGSSLDRRDPTRLKNAELKFWLKCRGDSCKGLSTKAQQLCKRYSKSSVCCSACEARFDL